METASDQDSPVRVGFYGEPGSYSESAARSLLDPLVRSGVFHGVGASSYEDLFKSAEQFSVHCSLIPVESTLTGSWHTNYDLLLRYSSLNILAEIDFRIEHCLLVLPGTKREQIKKVISAQTVLAACQDYLRNESFETSSVVDTGSAAKQIVEQRLTNTAAIGSRLCAEVYGLEVLEAGIDGTDTNYTRFLLVSAEATKVAPPCKDTMKTSIVLWLPHRDDALFQVLAAFSLRDINLTKLESRPVPAAYLEKFSVESGSKAVQDAPKKYEYFCYMDVLEDLSGKNMQSALKHLREITPFVRVLGSYPTYGADLHSMCAALRAMSLQNTALSKKAIPGQLTIAIIGFGNFGQFLAKEFTKKHLVLATSKSCYAKEAAALGCEWVPWDQMDSLFTKRSVDVILISTSITSFKSVVKSLSKEMLRQCSPLVTEVCSVKTFPKSVLLDEVPENCDIICTHPMFGPESGKHGWHGLPFVFDGVRVQNWERARRFISIWEDARCRIESMSCEQHDSYAASSQFLTHVTGRIMAVHGYNPTPLDLKGYKCLCRVADVVCNNSFDLFYGLFKYNTASLDTLRKLRQAFENIQGKLLSRRSIENVGQDRSRHGSMLSLTGVMQSHCKSAASSVQELTMQLQADGVEVNFCLCTEELERTVPAQVQISEEPITGWSPLNMQGEFKLRQRICCYLQERKSTTYKLDQICVSSCGKQAMMQALMMICEEGDQVIIPSPYWLSYGRIVRQCRACPIPVVTSVGDAYRMRPSSLQAALEESGAKCRALVICNPNDPTGAVMDAQSLEELAIVLRQPRFAHIQIIADEIYEQLVFDTEHTSFAALDGMASRTITVGGLFLDDAVSGCQLGYVAAPEGMASQLVKLQRHVAACASSFSQTAAIAALADTTRNCNKVCVQDLQRKRDIIIARLKDIPSISCNTPQSGFFVLVDLSQALGVGARATTSEEFCKIFLQEHKVALVPGDSFNAPLCVRISFACPIKDLEEALVHFDSCIRSVLPAS